MEVDGPENIPVIQVDNCLEEISSNNISDSFNVSLPLNSPAQVKQKSIETSLHFSLMLSPPMRLFKVGQKRVGIYLLVVTNTPILDCQANARMNGDVPKELRNAKLLYMNL